MKFAHFADCHIGGWREEELKNLGIESFKQAVEICLKEHVGFVLISGDLFNTALPSIDLIKEVAAILNMLKEEEIDVYMVAGSHDFSPSGKTMLDVLERAGLIRLVKADEFIVDKTGVKIAGMLGKRGGLEVEDYKEVDFSKLNQDGFKIFMFHTALEEFKPKDLEQVDCMKVSNLPKGINYYAGGHVHYLLEKDFENGKLVYPGALFPNNFKELEEFNHGSFCIVDDKLNVEFKKINLKDVISVFIDVDGLSVKKTEERIKENLQDDFKDKILLVRIEGVLKTGKPSDIKFRDILNLDAYCVLRNISKLKSKEFEAIKVEEGNIEEVEEKIIKKNVVGKEKLVKSLMKAFSLEKLEGERNMDFEKRLVDEVESVI